MTQKLTVIDMTERRVLRMNELPRWAHRLARDHAKLTGNKTIVMKPVAQYEQSTKKKRFK